MPRIINQLRLPPIAAIKANPRSPEALLLKGRAMLERAAVAEGDQTALFAEARKTFIAANKIDAEDPEPLLDFYRAFVREGVRPTANAIDALHYASNLAPQDVGVRMNSALAYLNEGKTRKRERRWSRLLTLAARRRRICRSASGDRADRCGRRKRRPPRPRFRAEPHNKVRFAPSASSSLRLAVEPAAHNRRASVAADHAMAGDQHRDMVVAIGGADCADGSGWPIAASDIGIAARLAERDLAKLAPHRFLECGAGERRSAVRAPTAGARSLRARLRPNARSFRRPEDRRIGESGAGHFRLRRTSAGRCPSEWQRSAVARAGCR